MSQATEEQLRIISNIGSNNMVIASPGSGKSFTMKKGVEAIFKKHPFAKVGMVTFTRAAADSLANSLKKQLPTEKFNRVLINTFHGFVSRQVKDTGWRGRLLMGNAQLAVINRAIKQSNSGLSYEDGASAIESIGREMNPDLISVKHTQHQIDLFNEYQLLCKKDNVADFNALSKYVVGQMRAYKTQPLNVTHLIVDEVQDTDGCQFAWVAEHTKRGIITSIVGDDDQTIYSFRAAGGVKIFQQFDRLFKPNIFYLNTCFRCQPEILAAADILIKHNEARYDKPLISGKNGGGKVTLLNFHDLDTQLEQVVKMVEGEPNGWAILCRSNAHLDRLENMFSQPTLRYGGKSFWDGKEPDDILHLFTFLRHPGDVNLMKRTLSLFGENEACLDAIAHEMQKRKVTFAGCDIPGTSNFATKSIHTHIARLTSETTDNEECKKRISNISKWLETSGMAMKNKEGGKSKAGYALESCLRWALKQGWNKMLNIAAGMTMGPKRDKEEYTEDKIVLSTLHGSKGLEWKKVVIISFNSDQIPSPKSIGQEMLEEERRLTYVGMTRAEQDLYFCWYGKASMFLREIYGDQIDTIENDPIMPVEEKEELLIE